MPPDQPVAHQTTIQHVDEQSQAKLPYEAVQDEGWLEEPEELPRRPRRRLFGAGGNPTALVLLAVLLIACGFIGGVLVEKGQTSSSSAGGSGGLASRFASLRGGASAAGASGRSATGSGGAASFFGGAGGAAGRTAGEVAYLAGSTLYVTNTEGNTVKVKTSADTTVTKSVSSSVEGIHPGETVTVSGTNTNGVVSAESISVGSAGGGLAALFGASGASRASSGSSGSSGGSTPALFGSG